MAETKRETTQPDSANHGVEVTPARVIPTDAGWLVKPGNERIYDGENEPWRR